ncbi:MAG: type II 3-dehydroquinate dehydratase [Bacteroidales bacterium]|nr:type II 3-dehydroquinate dehydratase [Bacteroidales bacterium]
MKIIIINGPNLNLLGQRQPEIYGYESFEDYLVRLRTMFGDIQLTYFQSNIEGEIINKIHDWSKNCDGIILNAGGYSHTSVAIHDAIKAISTPVVEVHLSNIFAREEFRHHSLTGAACIGSISGFGLKSYELALQFFVQKED